MRSIDHINDFPDKLNPMLVKELRQGLRGISFVTLFIAVQALLCFILLITTAVASDENAGHLLSRIIFFFFSLAVLIVQPLRGIAALHAEIKNDTIDLLCLTRLSAWRITYGKWISIVSQSALILTAIAPYLIMRYFFGDMQIFSELLFLLSIFLLSCLFTAGTVGLSATNTVIIRILFPIAAAGLVFIFIWNAFFDGRSTFQTLLEPVTLNSFNTTLIFLGFVCACVYTTWMLLDFGTSLIAPLSENRATRRRLVSFGLISITILAFAFANLDMQIALILGLILCTPVAIISLTENPNLVEPIVAPFTRKGLLGTTLGRILYPGWATGLVFVILLYAILYGLMSYYAMNSSNTHEHKFTILNSVFAVLLLSLACTRLFARKHENRFGLFMLFICSQFLIVLIIAALEKWLGGGKIEIMQYFFWIPTSAIYLEHSSGFSPTALLNASYVNVILYTAVIFATSIPVWKHIRSIEQASTSTP